MNRLRNFVESKGNELEELKQAYMKKEIENIEQAAKVQELEGKMHFYNSELQRLNGVVQKKN